jgi:uncharacterized membrane protein
MFKKLIWEERATISVLGALVLAAVVGISALAVEFGQALLQQSDDQRVADLAAYGGALVYNSIYNATRSVDSDATFAKTAATNIAALNGLTSGNSKVAPAVVPSPRGDGNQALQVTITTNLPMYLAQVAIASTMLPVAATAVAEIKPGPPRTALLVQ